MEAYCMNSEENDAPIIKSEKDMEPVLKLQKELKGYRGRLQKENDAPIIKLAQNIEAVLRLQKKLKDYRARHQKEIATIDAYKAPEQVFVMLAGTRYKIAVVEKLLLEGEVNTHELSRELLKKDGNVDAESFNVACAVIDDYMKTGGKNVTGGTGY